jgi:hypothetical protein
MEPTEALKKRIEDYKSSIALFMTSGGCKSMEEYARCAGKIETLDAIAADIAEIEKRYIES